MKSFTSITALLLCSLSWIFVPGSGSRTVKVQSGDGVTLLSLNISRIPTHTFWSRIVNTTEISCISLMYEPDGDVLLCEGFQGGTFEMSSNISFVFLKIKDVSDSGLYLCGFYLHQHTGMDVIRLNVKGSDGSDGDTDRECKEGLTKLTSVILAASTAVLVMVIIGLLVQIWKLQTALNEDHQKQNLGSNEMNYAALSFHPPTRRNHRPASEREMEPNVVYAATR
ncbi:uncharacterized protein LOC103361164 [Stegastes partitus]|uniref:Uncharacterized LOC103361164 n=1 Tax=Stegastes partitus TaxID=144197 RepID=A0A3B4ZWV2_9TELE|nr:PREDICTED: uncharacterized protein LOC103361164 [Stegastes partitus]